MNLLRGEQGELVEGGEEGGDKGQVEEEVVEAGKVRKEDTQIGIAGLRRGEKRG